MHDHRSRHVAIQGTTEGAGMYAERERLGSDRPALWPCTGRPVVRRPTAMRGNVVGILRQPAAGGPKGDQPDLAPRRALLYVTLDPTDLPDHPERLAPVPAAAGRMFGVDLDPDWIGLSVCP
ncbi:MAG: hypothetical protein K2X54_18970 [Methylobacterium organophilum]|nr:hypothetical protein [Methylobacterium organophilum]